MLVTQQGDGVSSFREIMIRQNADDHRRKLLETRSFHFVIFLDGRGGIVGFDLEDRDSSHLFQWRKGRRPKFYGVANVGKGYHNRDEVYINGRFTSADAVTELNKYGQNIRSEVRCTLLEGISSYH
jgi:hypothetical protein